MAVAKGATFTFKNQVRSDYTSYFFRKYLFWAALAYKIVSDFNMKPGRKVDIPYFKAMGAAEKLQEDTRMSVDSMGDKSISATVYEAGKAWGITDTGRYSKGSTDSEWEDEASSQAGRRIAELVDSDALACLNNDGTNSIDGAAGNDPKGHDEIDNTADFTLATPFDSDRGTDDAKFKAQMCNVVDLQQGFTQLFGDRQKEANILAMHSFCYTDAMLNVNSGIMKADAITPAGAVVNGFMGNYLGKDTFMIDNISKGDDLSVTDSAGVVQKYVTRKNFILKPKFMVLLQKQITLYEAARDILGRIDYNAATLWYTFYPLHLQNNSDDKRAGAIVSATRERTT